MWSQLFFWGFVVVMEITMLVTNIPVKSNDDAVGLIGALVLFPFLALGVRKYRRWLYVRNHTVFVKRVD